MISNYVRTTAAVAVAVAAAFLTACSSLGDLSTPLSLNCADASYAEDSGTLPDGTPWGMRKPAKWNGVLISDLDYVLGKDSERSCALLNRGYALSGLNRHPRRAFLWDPAKEIANLLAVMDMFEQKHGRPRRTVEFGTSGGGLDALLMSELHADRIQGAVATCAHEGLPMWNVQLDGWFILQQLIAPHLPIAGYRDLNAVDEAVARWKTALTDAQATPVGRARIALAVAAGQWSAWTTASKAIPNHKDVNALQQAMFDTVLNQANQPGGQSRFMAEHAGEFPVPRQLSWNHTVDYEQFFANADPDYAAVARESYRQAGRDMAADFALLKAAPRVQPSPEAISFWNGNPRRVVNGTPKVPVMRIHETGDNIAPPVQVTGYAQKMRANNGDASLYRVAIVQSGGHCLFSPSESVAAVETLMRRLDTGVWPETSPQALNTLGNRLIPQRPARFVDERLPTSNRAANRP